MRLQSAHERVRPSAAVYRRRRLVVGIAILGALGVLSGGGAAVATLDRPLPNAVVAVSQSSSLTGDPALLDLPASGRMALSATGFPGLIAQSGEQDAAPIASITKIITALVVLQTKPIPTGDGPTITFTDADVRIREAVIADNGSNAVVSAGLSLTERHALTVMLLASANNYAISLANWAYGSQEAFVSAATTWLAAHELSNTRIVEPTGLSPLNEASPADLVLLAQLAEADPVVSDIVDELEADIPGVGIVTNTNTLLGQAGIVGVKTGTTDEAGSCLLFAAKIQVGGSAVLLTGVLLGSDSHAIVDDEVIALVRSATAAFREVPIVASSAEVATVRTAWGETARVLAADSLSVVAFGDLPVVVRTEIRPLQTGGAGALVGSIVVTSGTRTQQSDAILATPLTDPGPWWRLGHADQLVGSGTRISDQSGRLALIASPED